MTWYKTKEFIRDILLVAMLLGLVYALLSVWAGFIAYMVFIMSNPFYWEGFVGSMCIVMIVVVIWFMFIIMKKNYESI